MDNEKMDGLSMDIELTEQDKLRSLFPQCVVDGKLSVTKLRKYAESLKPLTRMTAKSTSSAGKANRSAYSLRGNVARELYARVLRRAKIGKIHKMCT